MIHDVAIVGAGPAGTACGIVCADAGLRTVMIEREIFPREKVCGDCINPRCWPLLDALGVAEAIAAAPHLPLDAVQFSGITGPPLRIPFPTAERGEIAIKRSLFDHLLLQRASAAGVDVRQGTALTGLTRTANGWSIQQGSAHLSARLVVAADGRNSTVARLLGILPDARRERVALQTHIATTEKCEASVALRFLPWGYCGVAPVNDRELNVCLVTSPAMIREARQWAADEWRLSPGGPTTWRTITPLTRAAVKADVPDLLVVGDAARVVEPFTGEGIYYALASGMLAGRCVAEKRLADYGSAHDALYRGRLWINRAARWATLHPQTASFVLRVARTAPGALATLTQRVVRVESPRTRTSP